MTSFAIDPSKSKAMNVQNPYDFAGVSVSTTNLCLLKTLTFCDISGQTPALVVPARRHWIAR